MKTVLVLSVILSREVVKKRAIYISKKCSRQLFGLALS